ncbi:hypothetical protein GUITHDRAFT_109221 [Guillardia theta CCMP2712]|uniref:Uncharacterized protein n=1 Tax=Guillardia theta (strain CCMP2712) TaxID=905079 RepID=L1J9P9_GUITC|nr:hypothetical protein GUITHDRAFT_109221 [Guillardia theta CCMP2712]EKX44795.1 hypothetical protein GUITHDRAFT_109221 [Guillardia theta CCMP2712]|eukprot:XP_005831775.1 hypothetical protein GUITHDRAFT_109221 [Guillardia theta CCMP2712]
MYVYGIIENLNIVVVFHRKKLIRFVIESSTKRKFAAKLVSTDHSELSKRALEKCLLRNLVLPMRSKLLCLSVDELKNLTVKFSPSSRPLKNRKQYVKALIHSKFRCLSNAEHSPRNRELQAVSIDVRRHFPTRKEKLRVIEFYHFTMKTFVLLLNELCSMRFDELYHMLSRHGRAPGNLTSNGNIRGRMKKAHVGNAWVMEIGITAMDRITKIDLVFGCLFHEMPEITNCLVDDYFISALRSIGAENRTCYMVAHRVRQRLCQSYGVKYISTNGRNRWLVHHLKTKLCFVVEDAIICLHSAFLHASKLKRLLVHEDISWNLTFSDIIATEQESNTCEKSCQTLECHSPEFSSELCLKYSAGLCKPKEIVGSDFFLFEWLMLKECW